MNETVHRDFSEAKHINEIISLIHNKQQPIGEILDYNQLKTVDKYCNDICRQALMVEDKALNDINSYDIFNLNYIRKAIEKISKDVLLSDQQKNF